MFRRMSTVAEIEQAIGQLPPEQWTEIRRWMDAHAPKTAQAGEVDWSRSASVTRRRAPETQLQARIVMEALAAVRE